MKFILAIAFICLFQHALCMPMEFNEVADVEGPCTDIFSDILCTGFEEIDNEVMDTIDRERRQLPPVDTDLLEKLLKKKIEFLMNFGLLKRIPFLGQAIHDFVAQDPEGVARALKGGIGGLIQIGVQLLGRIG